MNLKAFPILLVSALFLNGCAKSSEDQVARNVDVSRIVAEEVWSKGRVELIEDFFVTDYIGHFPAGTFHGRKGLTERVLAHRKAFPDWTEEIVDTIAQGDRVAIRFISRGTNRGEFLGNPPTGNRVEISEVCIYRMSNGQIAEQWVYPDILSMQQQLASTDLVGAKF